MNPYLETLKRAALSRRMFFAAAGSAAAVGALAWYARKAGPLYMPGLYPEKWWGLAQQKPASSPVVILKAATYEQDLVSLIKHGIEACQLPVRDKTVLLKPNLVEFSDERPINTNALVVAAALEAFRSLGARQVIVGEGAGHRRDTELMVEATGLGEILRKSKTEFVDLNLDDVRKVALRSRFTGLPELYASKTLLGCDLVVSMPKLKTHHWVGTTLSMKNLFGCIPGAVYGWPKNLLHWCGIGESIVDICAALRPGFAIVDGIVGMEGDGPINGTAKPFGALIMGTDLVAVDATCARLMGIDPVQVTYLQGAGKFLGHLTETEITQRGEAIAPLVQPFQLPGRMAALLKPT
jgi:uncharacterized protein (DUF362 family)